MPGFLNKTVNDDDPPVDLTDEEIKDMAGAANILATLIFNSAMTPEEKEAWINLIPVMDGDQLLQLQKVLMLEQLGKIEYEALLDLKQQVMDINDKYNKKILKSQEEAMANLDELEKEIDSYPEK